MIFLALRPSSQTSQTPPTPAATPTQSPIAPAVTALGRVEPAGEIVRVAAPSSSGNAVPVFGTPRVARLLVKERSPVKAGQPIAVLDTYDRLFAAGKQTEAQLREAEAQLNQVRAGAKPGEIAAQRSTIAARAATVDRLTATAQKLKWEAERYLTLFRDGAVSEQEARNRQLLYTEVVRELEKAKRELDEAQSTLSSIAEIRPTDIQEAEAGVRVALANLERAKVELESAIVRSPIEGQVIKIHSKEGEQVGNDGILEIGNTNQMYVVAEVYETDIQRVKPGQRALITSSAFPGEITGVVDQIGLLIRKNDVLNTDPAADTDVRVVEVKIRLDDSRPVAGLTNLQVKVKIEP